MQTVNDRWYKIYAALFAALSGGILLACLVTVAVPAWRAPRLHWGLSNLTIVLSCLALAYYFLIYPRLARKQGYFTATLIMSVVFMLNSVNLTNSTGQFHSLYYLIWILLVAWAGIFGLYGIVVYVFLASIYLILIMTNTKGKLTLDLFSLAVLGVTYVVGIVGFLLWQRAYEHPQENAQIAQLSGQLKSKEKQAEILIQSITDGLLVINTDGKITLMNPAAAKLTGWPVADALSLDVNSVIKLKREDGKELPPEQNPFANVLLHKQEQSTILQLQTRDGQSTMIVSLAVSPVLLPNTQDVVGAVAVMRDISDARAEEQRRADFISTASHEMRTPVAAIEGYLALAMNENVSKIDAKAREFLEKAHSSTQHLGKLFQDLLTSAKAEDGRLSSHPKVTELGAFLEQIVDSLKFSAEKKGLLMEFVIGAGSEGAGVGGGKVIRPLYYTFVDPDRLREVITNIFDNAVKYTETGKISVGLTGNNDVVQFYVRDTGPGIPETDLPHLFQKFYRVDNTATRTIGGTGLGLFICKKIVELYKGRIWVDSAVGKGSTFYINLPRLTAQKATELQQKEASELSQI